MKTKTKTQKIKESEKAATNEAFTYYENMGLVTADVETAIRGTFFKKDLLGFLDGLAFGCNKVIGFQSTVLSKKSTRYKKIISSPMSYIWLLAGLEIDLVCYSEKGLDITYIDISMLPEETKKKALNVKRWR